jgi:hypothetical protein
MQLISLHWQLLSTFWRPECTVGGDDGQQVTVHDPEVDVHSQCALLSSKVMLPYSIRFINYTPCILKRM